MTKHAHRGATFMVLVLLAGCAAYATGGQFLAGRRALLINDNETALGYFLATAQSDPNYYFQFVDFREGIWTYVGRTQYAIKRYSEALESLERALKMDRDDNMARLYYGLTLARTADLSRGVKEIESAMKGIHAFLEYQERARPLFNFWDPLREIRGAIEKDLANISGRDFNPEQLLANAEWLGKRMEEEVDNVRGDERREWNRQFDRQRSGSGGSIGVGIGF
jgi:tetratricopeptide (TPR) repeat protein